MAIKQLSHSHWCGYRPSAGMVYRPRSLCFSTAVACANKSSAPLMLCSIAQDPPEGRLRGLDSLGPFLIEIIDVRRRWVVAAGGRICHASIAWRRLTLRAYLIAQVALRPANKWLYLPGFEWLGVNKAAWPNTQTTGTHEC